MNYNLLWKEYFYTWITEPVNWLMIHKTQSLNPSLIIWITFHGTIQNFPSKYYLGCKFKTQVSHNKICYGHKTGLTLNKCEKLLKGHNEKHSGNYSISLFSQKYYLGGGGEESCWQTNRIHHNLQLVCWQSVHTSNV